MDAETRAKVFPRRRRIRYLAVDRGHCFLAGERELADIILALAYAEAEPHPEATPPFNQLN